MAWLQLSGRHHLVSGGPAEELKMLSPSIIIPSSERLETG